MKIKKNIILPVNNRHIDVIISLTTYEKRILKRNIEKVIDRILFDQDPEISVKIIINVTEKDKLFFSQDQLAYFDKHDIELFICEKDLRPHLKYFYTMQRYREYPVITIDDDCLYDDNLVSDLWKSYKDHPDCVSARRCHLMISDRNNFLVPYQKWIKKFTNIKTPTHELFATGVGGVIYPPDILKISEKCLDDIQKSITADDIYLKKREQELGVKVIYCGNNPDSYENLPEWKENALQLENNSGGRNNEIIKNLGLKPMVNLLGRRTLNVFMRMCDSIDCVNNNLCKNKKREFGNGKKDVILTCTRQFVKAVKKAHADGFTINIAIINDGLNAETVAEIDYLARKNDIDFDWVKSNGNGNINSFRTCFEKAILLKDYEYVMFAEDDYLWDEDSISEILRFLNMFDGSDDFVWLNPTSDIGDNKIVPLNEDRTYQNTVVLPSSKNGKGIWWKRTYHSTSTFVTNVSQLRKYENVFRDMFKGEKLDQYQRNNIYRIEKCFTPVGCLMQHYQKSKTMYWFDNRNLEREKQYDTMLLSNNTQLNNFSRSFINMLKYSFVISINDQQLEYFKKMFKYVFGCNCHNPNHMTGFSGELPHFEFAKCHLETKNRKYFFNVLNCLLSHIQCVHSAKALDWPYVIIFEDDAVFDYSKFNLKQLDECLNDIPDDCIGFTLGSRCRPHNGLVEEKRINSHFMRFENIGSHAYVVLKRGYDQFIDAAVKVRHADHMWDSLENFYMSINNFFIQSRKYDLENSISKTTGVDFNVK